MWSDKTHFVLSTASTGIVSMEAKDYENPDDNNNDNIYNIEITATDSDAILATTSWTLR